MKITILQDGESHDCDVVEGESIASAAERIGIKLLGACQGRGICNMCSRQVVAGMDNILNQKTQQLAIPDNGYAPYTRTCTSIPTEEGVVINADRKARLT